MERSEWAKGEHWERVGQQDRSRRTQAALIDAAARLFADRGFEKTTVADIAEQAGCSIGAFYHHYRDKKAIQYALFERMIEDFDRTIASTAESERWDGVGIAEIMRFYASTSLAADRRRPGFRRAGAAVARRVPELQGHLDGRRMALDRGIRKLLEERRHTIGHPDPDLAISYALEHLGSMVRVRVHEPRLATRMGDRTDEEFVAELVSALTTYLRLDGQG